MPMYCILMPAVVLCSDTHHCALYIQIYTTALYTLIYIVVLHTLVYAFVLHTLIHTAVLQPASACPHTQQLASRHLA